MPKMTVYPVGNADTSLLDLANGEKILFDFANYHDPKKRDEKRIDLAEALREDLRRANRKNYDVVAFTHLDDDHIHGATDFFELSYSKTYQGKNSAGKDRVGIKTLWVPAAAIIEENLPEEARIIQKEARARLRNGANIRVFSRPDSLKDWLRDNGLSVQARKNLIIDAGTLIPDFTTSAHGVEFFVHSPFAEHAEDGGVVQRNKGALVLQATFTCAGQVARVLLGADIDHEVLDDIVRITRHRGRDERLLWDVFKIPHHCSYKSLGPVQGTKITTPVPHVGWLYEKQGQKRGILVASSWPIPSNDDDPQPPHRQAAAYYDKQAARLTGHFLVTMAHPTEVSPEPVVITIDHLGATPKKPGLRGGAYVTGVPAPRAG